MYQHPRCAAACENVRSALQWVSEGLLFATCLADTPDFGSAHGLGPINYYNLGCSPLY